MHNSFKEHQELFYKLIPEGTPYLHPIGISGCNNTIIMYLYCAAMKEEEALARDIFDKYMTRVMEIIPVVDSLPHNSKCRMRLNAIADLFFDTEVVMTEVTDPEDDGVYLAEVHIDPSTTRKVSEDGVITQTGAEEGSNYVNHMGLYSKDIGVVLFNKINNEDFDSYTLYEIKQDLTVPQG